MLSFIIFKVSLPYHSVSPLNEYHRTYFITLKLANISKLIWNPFFNKHRLRETTYLLMNSYSAHVLCILLITKLLIPPSESHLFRCIGNLESLQKKTDSILFRKLVLHLTLFSSSTEPIYLDYHRVCVT